MGKKTYFYPHFVDKKYEEKICLTFSLLLKREIVIYSLMNHLIKAVFAEQPLAFSSLLLIMVVFVNFLGRPLTA